MSRIYSGLTRAPDMMLSRLALGQISRTNVDLFKLQTELSTGKAINKFSDDAVRAATIVELNQRIDHADQRARNFSHATGSLGIADNALSEASDLGLQAKEILSSMVGSLVSSGDRQQQADIVDTMLGSLLNIANRASVSGYAFAASNSSVPPYEQVGGGYEYRGQGSGLTTDLGLASTVPITLRPDALGATSARVAGSVDLNPALTADTRLADLNGAAGLGVRLGKVEFTFGSGPRARIDLSACDTAGDVVDALNSAIHQYETDNSVTILGAGGVGISGGGFSFDLAANTGNPALEFYDISNGSAAQDLGLATSPPTSFTSPGGTGADTAPRLTMRSSIASLAGVNGSLGTIVVKNNGKAARVDLSNAQTIEDVKNAIERTGIGVRVEINTNGTGINVLSDVSAGMRGALSIEEGSDTTFTATRLGIRSFSDSTSLADFNFGKGVGIVNGSVDPVTGLPDPARDVDFTITLGNAAATPITIDLRPQDVVSVGTLIARINDQASTQLAAAGLPTNALVAALGDGANGIRLIQDATYPNAIKVATNNNSPAAEQLGLANGSYDPASATFAGEDRARVRVDGMFSDLIDLRDTLRGNDTRGMGIAGEKLEATLRQVSQLRGAVGGYSQRVEQATQNEEDRTTLDKSIRSQLQDSDFTSAASRFTLLQTQLSAALQVTAQAGSRTLLDYLG